MNTGLITYSDKTALNENASIADVNKVKATDMNEIKTAINTGLVDLIYPVGAIFLSTASANPSTYLGGTWVQIKDKFLLGAGDTYTAGATGGNATVNLSHNHNAGSLMASLNFEGGGIRYFYDSSVKPAYNYTETLSATEQSGSGTMYGGTRVVGATANALTSSQNILPPYIVVYVWQRTA